MSAPYRPRKSLWLAVLSLIAVAMAFAIVPTSTAFEIHERIAPQQHYQRHHHHHQQQRHHQHGNKPPSAPAPAAQQAAAVFAEATQAPKAPPEATGASKPAQNRPRGANADGGSRGPGPRRTATRKMPAGDIFVEEVYKPDESPLSQICNGGQEESITFHVWRMRDMVADAIYERFLSQIEGSAKAVAQSVQYGAAILLGDDVTEDGAGKSSAPSAAQPSPAKPYPRRSGVSSEDGGASNGGIVDSLFSNVYYVLSSLPHLVLDVILYCMLLAVFFGSLALVAWSAWKIVKYLLYGGNDGRVSGRKSQQRAPQSRNRPTAAGLTLVDEIVMTALELFKSFWPTTESRKKVQTRVAAIGYDDDDSQEIHGTRRVRSWK
jgi:hypothetical protein